MKVAEKEPRPTFSTAAFLRTSGAGRKTMAFRKGQNIFRQGESANAIFVILGGRVRLSARSNNGKIATLGLLTDRDFVGEDCIAGERLRTASATAMTDCTVLRIAKKIMMHALAREVSLSNLLCSYVLRRNIRRQQDLVDLVCNLSEKRLARILLSLAHFDGESTDDAMVPHISHRTLAEMVGTTRSRVALFMTQFRANGLIDYKNRSHPMRIRRSLVAFQAS